MKPHDGAVPLHVTYDPEADAAYIHFQAEIAPGAAVRTVCVDEQEIDGMVNLDLDKTGRILGVEVLEAARLLPRDLLRHFEI